MNLVFRSILISFVFLPLFINGCASKGPSVAGSDVPGGDPWFRAARTGDVATMRKMIEAGKKVDDPTGTGLTALMNASRSGSPEVIKFLIDHGADASKVDQDGQSALVYALVGHATGPKLERVVDLLLKAGANPFAVDKLGFQPVQHMLESDMDEQIRNLKFTDKKPCDLLPAQPGQVPISKAARRMEKVALAEFLEKEGCW